MDNNNLALFLLRRREEEEFEFINFIHPVTNGDETSERRRIHTSVLTGAMYVQEVLEGHDERCKREFRMETHVFKALVKCLRDKGLISDTKYVSAEEQVAMFLFTLSKNASNRTVQERFQHSGETVSRHFRVVLEAITQLTEDLIQRPLAITPSSIRWNSKFYPYFENYFGAIDGTHIPISIATSLQEPYRNRKQTLSQNVMVACDFNLRFVYVRAGWERSASDARILQDALNNGFTVPLGKYYLVDAGYANTLSFIAPYRGIRYHLREHGAANEKPKDYKELFNLRHLQLRNHIERIIGIIKMRFPILKVATYHSINNQTDIVMACCVLHNFIRNHNGTEDWLNDGISEIRNYEIIDVSDGDAEYAEDIDSMNNQRRAGNLKREEIVKKMWTDYIARHQSRRNS
ncbi:putative nuclease HARBI1 [Ananas comosus]|uniref:Nuclease HARBI1 n=1 Tax=Ananas comosus TaxID=4615 RepID=A0A6P5FH44_ANACO|nr:putative nuclease HARBI1 [Ananas comosus]